MQSIKGTRLRTLQLVAAVEATCKTNAAPGSSTCAVAAGASFDETPLHSIGHLQQDSMPDNAVQSTEGAEVTRKSMRYTMLSVVSPHLLVAHQTAAPSTRTPAVAVPTPAPKTPTARSQLTSAQHTAGAAAVQVTVSAHKESIGVQPVAADLLVAALAPANAALTTAAVLALLRLYRTLEGILPQAYTRTYTYLSMITSLYITCR